MPNIRDLYRLDTSKITGLMEAQGILVHYSFDSEFIDWIMMVLRANNRLTEDADKEVCQMCSEIEEENVRLEKEVARLEQALTAAGYPAAA